MRLALKRFWTLRQWSNLLVVVCVLPATAATMLLVYYSYERERARVEQATLQTARAMMMAVDHELWSAEASLRALSTSSLLLSGELAGFQQQAQQALRGQPGAAIALSNSAGQQLVNTLQPYGSPLPGHGDPGHLRRVVTTGGTVVSNLYYDPGGHRAQVGVDLPVRRDSELIYVLSLLMPVERFGEILRQQRLPSGWLVAVLDGEGVIIARNKYSERFIGQPVVPELLRRIEQAPEGSLEASTLEGVPAVISFSRSPVSNWAVAIGVPRAALTIELWRSIAWVVAGSLLLLLCSLMLVRYVGERLTRSIRALAEPAMALGYGRPFAIPQMYLREANDVAQALCKASGLLQERTTQRDLAEKTSAELTRVKQQLEQSDSLQRAIFAQAPDALVLVGPDGRIVRANERACAVFGYGCERLLELAVEDLMPPAINPGVTPWAGCLGLPVRRPVVDGAQLFARRADCTVFPVDVMLSPLSAPDGGQDLLIATVRDVTERRRNEEALRASEKRFRNMLEHAPIGMSLVSPDGRWLEVNNALCELVGYGKAEMLRMKIQDITHPDDIERDLACARRLLDGEIRSCQFEKRYIRQDGSIASVLMTRSLLRDEAGKPLHFIAQIEDISARKRSEEQLTALNKRLALATQAGGIAVWETNLPSGAMWWDERMYQLYRVAPVEGADVQQIWRSHVHPDHLKRVERELKEAVRSGIMLSTEFPILWSDGQTRIIRANAVLSYDSDGRAVRMTGINWDITQSRQREEAIGAALREKDTLLRELYHRVKNNLQVISSMLNLQLRTLPEAAARTALQESADRVRAMALVHEKLYQSKNLSSIALNDYIDDLCRQLGNAAGADQRGISLNAVAEPVDVGLQLAIPLGLVLNELLANSLRHAFPDGRRGSITVRLEHQADGSLLLCVADDGVGMPPGMSPATTRSLGLKLVHALATQLDGKFQIQSGQGTTARLTFHLPRGAQAGAAQAALAAA